MDQVIIIIAMAIYGGLGIFVIEKEKQRSIFWSVSVIVESLIMVSCLATCFLSAIKYSPPTLLIAIRLWLLWLYIDIFSWMFFRREIFGN